MLDILRVFTHSTTTTTNRKEKMKMKKHINKITKEARLVVSLLIVSVFVLAYWITEAGKLGDIYGSFVLLGALVFVSATASFIVTDEVRSASFARVRRTISKHNTQQVETLTQRIFTLEAEARHRDAHNLELIDALEFGAITEIGLCAIVRSLYKFDAKSSDIRKHLEAIELQADDGIDADDLTRYAYAWHNGEALPYGDDLAWMENIERRASQAIDGGDLVTDIKYDEQDFTYSASTALMLGTLDKPKQVRTSSGWQTVYPVK